jgi:thioredoxin 1
MAKGIVDVSEQNFEKEVLKSNTVVLVDFWAEWCGPCKALTPVLEEIAQTAEGKFKIAKVNIDENSDLATKLEVLNIPTMILFKGGEEVDRLVGYMPKAKIMAKIDSIL